MNRPKFDRLKEESDLKRNETSLQYAVRMLALSAEALEEAQEVGSILSLIEARGILKRHIAEQ